MDWLTLSLMAAALWGGSNVVDKVLIEKHIPSPLLCAFFMGAYGVISALVVAMTARLHFESLGGVALACLSGVRYSIYRLLSFAALSHGEATVVAALGQITPLFAALWDYLVLGQVFGVMTYVGVGGVVLGAVLISL